ncbi:DUF2798 domain-containing protein [Planococcus sp. A6]|uniref:DUF2798 domain-containing protein n=1 Tax=Planococcus sp. A6 TaxID=2992760 RepID=UPI00237A6098|nr:DUF2798 domain-containing protein [Planococcus sp. A6]MDE0584085.1 DUF2798 domain-containing protein [Planococcus sp. A6]
MQKDKRLPHNGKEGLLYGSLIVTMTVLLMSSYSVLFYTDHLTMDTLWIILKIMPVMWISAMVLEAAVFGRIAESLTANLTNTSSSFHQKILLRIVFTVIGMSVAMTFIGDMAANGFHGEIFSHWLANWPRNFLIVLLAESLLIQPLARLAMVKQHAAQDRKTAIAQ